MCSWWGWSTVEEVLSERKTHDLTVRITALLPDYDVTDHRPLDPNVLGFATSRITPSASLAKLFLVDPIDQADPFRSKEFCDVMCNL